MSNDYTDPSANTQAFQAWVDQSTTPAAAPAPPNRTPIIIGAVVAVIVIVAVVAFLALG